MAQLLWQHIKRGAPYVVLLTLCVVVMLSPQLLVAVTRRGVADEAAGADGKEVDASAATTPPKATPQEATPQNATSKRNSWFTDLPKPGEAPMHVVFMGDSIMRYQYLDLVYRLHFPGKRPPARLLFCGCPSWSNFFRMSTQLFNGSMTCDCSRLKPRGVDVLRTLENRFYRHPSAPLSLTYLQLFGEVKLSSRVPLNQTSLASLVTPPVADVRNQSWHYFQQPLLTIVKTHVATMEPKPTHIVLNIGHWDHASLVGSFGSIMWALHNITPNVVWRQTSQPAPGSIGFRTRSAQLSWSSFRDRRQFLDAMMRDVCVVRQTSATTSKKKKPCYFFPLPGGPLPGKLIHAHEFSDFIHPHAHWYACWNARLWSLLRRRSPWTSWDVHWNDVPLPLDCLSFSQTTLATTDQRTLELMDAADPS